MLICYGTRAEYIKLLSLITNIKCDTLFTGQHTDLIGDHNPTYHTQINECGDNRINNIISSIKTNTKSIINNYEYIMVQGDTTSAYSIALTAYDLNKKIIHLEAGLRSHNINNPYPEEINRISISKMAYIHLCSTELDKINLLNEKITNNIYVVGNTILDNISKTNICYENIVLITLHRSENVKIIDQYFTILNNIAKKYPDLCFIIPLHPNPDIIKHKHLLTNVNIIQPQSHNELINLIKKCKFIISDSGGIQEEASYLNKKIIICRENTERPQVLKNHGVLCKDVSNLENIFDKINKNYKVNPKYLDSCPFGDGKSWIKIKSLLNDRW